MATRSTKLEGTSSFILMMFELEGDALELLPMSEFGTNGLPVNTAAGVAPWRCQFSEDCTTNISECEFPTGTAWIEC